MTDQYTLLAVLAAASLGAVIGFCVSSLMGHKAVAAARTGQTQAELLINGALDHVDAANSTIRALIANGGGLTNAIADLRARKPNIGADVDAAVNRWTQVRIAAEKAD